jgi:hypothetical protein
MMVKVRSRVNGRCRRGSRHMKGRKGCYRKSNTHMGGKKR